MRFGTCTLAAALLLSAPAICARDSAIGAEQAEAVFDQARTLCEADGGRLWGVSLCGPIMLVDPGTRQIVAAQADANGLLKAEQGVFAGKLPEDLNMANTAFEWSGVRWTQMLWPLPESDAERDTLIAHELFHRIQPTLPIAKANGGENRHLDTLEGRYTLQLEWRALARAVRSDDRAEKRAAMADALALRAERYRLFPDARLDEAALELNEGLAEYTGVMVGNSTPQARAAAALRDLEIHVGDPSFVRSFAYATGPAYGLLLDDFSPGWRGRLGDEPMDLGARLRDATGAVPALGGAALPAIASRYDGSTLRTSESAREEKRLAQLKFNRRRFVEGPVLVLELAHMSVQFNPGNLQPLDDVGTVYPTMRVSDDWGTLDVDGGALMRSDWKAVIVAAPLQPVGSRLQGAGWTLELKPGWSLSPGARAGDYALERAVDEALSPKAGTPGPERADAAPTRPSG